MVCDVGDIGREKSLIFLVHLDGDIGPPQKCLNERRAVIELGLGFYDALPGMQGIPTIPFIRSWFVFAEPDRAPPVFVLFDLVIDRHECGRSVVLRPVELHPPEIQGPNRPTRAGLMTFCR